MDDDDTPKNPFEFLRFVPKHAPSRHRANTSPENREPQQCLFADAAMLVDGQIFVDTECRECNEVENTEKEKEINQIHDVSIGKLC